MAIPSRMDTLLTVHHLSHAQFLKSNQNSITKTRSADYYKIRALENRPHQTGRFRTRRNRTG